VGGSLIFEVSSWPRQLNDIVPRSYSWALARAMQTVGVKYEMKGWAHSLGAAWQRPKILRRRKDWTWKQVSHEFQGLLGLHSEWHRWRWLLIRLDDPQEYGTSTYDRACIPAH
jgi:hypothetical protein